MLYLQPNQSNNIVVTWSERATSTSAAFYLLEVQHIATLVKTIVVVPKASNLSTYARYDKFNIVAQFASEGQYTYTAYEATGVTLETAIAVVETGLMQVAMTEQSYENAGGDTLYVQAGDNTTALNPAPAPLIITNAGVYAGFAEVQVSGVVSGNIYYTTDGTTPSSQNGTLYNDAARPIIQSTALFQARLYSDGYTLGNVASAYYIIIPVNVSAVPAGGTYPLNTLDPIELITNNEDADIYYTLDGSEPTTGSTLYTGAISPFAVITTLKFRAFLAPATPSAIVTEQYNIKALTPRASVNSGTFISSIFVELFNDNPLGVTQYSTDGGVNWVTDTEFTADVSANYLIRVVDANYITSDSLALNVEIQCAAPTIVPNGGVFEIDEEVLFQTNEPNGTTYYTLDGSTPTTSSLTANPFTITATTTVKARTFRTGCTPSVVTEAAFTKLFKAAIAGAFSGRIYKSENIFATWSEMNILGLSNQTWTQVLMGENGLFTQATTATQIRYSTDQLATWQTPTTPSPIVSIAQIAADKSGQKVLMLANIGNSRNQVLLSTNGGASFADITPNLATYNNIAVSPDGTRLYCAKVGNNATNVNDDVIYVSFNDGATWSATFTQNQRRISALNATDDSVIFCRFNNATDAFQGVFRSTDNGTTQTLISSSANFRGVYASGDESLIMIFSILQTDTLLVSLNQGTSFSNFTLPASVTTIRLTSSYDGQRAMIGTSTRLYVSTDKMTSVTESQPAGNVNRTWQAAATLS